MSKSHLCVGKTKSYQTINKKQESDIQHPRTLVLFPLTELAKAGYYLSCSVPLLSPNMHQLRKLRYQAVVFFETQGR